MSAELLCGRVWHSRLRPSAHRFVYPLCQLRIPLSGLDGLDRPLLRVDRAGLLSIHQKDYGPRDGTPLLPWIRGRLRERGLHCADGEVWLQTMPRMFGYCFNPVSFWFCEDRQGRLRAVLCDVNNTFGNNRQYLLAHADQRPIAPEDWLWADKTLHVSPFFRVEGSYRFRFDRFRGVAAIQYDDGDGVVLRTGVIVRARALTTGALAAAIGRHGWFTLAVWLRIHYQALRLWLKKVPFYGKQPETHPHEEIR
jgi:uncharacterized protein